MWYILPIICAVLAFIAGAWWAYCKVVRHADEVLSILSFEPKTLKEILRDLGKPEHLVPETAFTYEALNLLVKEGWVAIIHQQDRHILRATWARKKMGRRRPVKRYTFASLQTAGERA